MPPRPSGNPPARAPFVLLVSAILGGGLVLVLLINTWLAQGSFTVKRLQDQQTALRNQAQAVAQQIAAQSAPDALAVRAAELGMVPAPNPVFKTRDGAVLGVAQTAQAAVRPAPPPQPPAATPSASTSSSPSASASANPSPKASSNPSPKASANPSPKTSTPPKPSAPAAKPSAPTQGSHG